jgi:hypothetical protein
MCAAVKTAELFTRLLRRPLISVDEAKDFAAWALDGEIAGA